MSERSSSEGINGSTVTLYLQEQKCLITLIALKPLLLLSPPTHVTSVVLQAGLVSSRLSMVQRSENNRLPASGALELCFAQDSLLLPCTSTLPLPRGDFVNLTPLTPLDISFLQPLQCRLELCQCHSLLRLRGELPPGVPAMQPQSRRHAALSQSSFSSPHQQNAAEPFWVVVFLLA